MDIDQHAKEEPTKCVTIEKQVTVSYEWDIT